MKFSLRDLCWLLLTIAIVLGAYRWGFQSGRVYQDPIVISTHAHILPFKLNNAGGALRCKHIRQCVEPDTWEEPESVLDFVPDTNTLIVRNTNQVQNQIVAAIKELGRIEDRYNKDLYKKFPTAPRS